MVRTVTSVLKRLIFLNVFILCFEMLRLSNNAFISFQSGKNYFISLKWLTHFPLPYFPFLKYAASFRVLCFISPSLLSGLISNVSDSYSHASCVIYLLALVFEKYLHTYVVFAKTFIPVMFVSFLCTLLCSTPSHFPFQYFYTLTCLCCLLYF